MNTEDTKILLFDGYCNLCNRIVRFTIKRDPKAKFKFAALQSEEGKALLTKLGLKTNDHDTVVLIIGNEYFVRSSAGLRVLRELGGFWKMWYVLIYLPKPFRDKIYSLIAKTRYRIFGKRTDCMVPSEEIRQRFL